MVVVIVIIGIVAGITIPRFLGPRVTTKVTQAFTDMRTIADALERYHMDKTVYPTALADADLATYITSIPTDPFGGAAFGYYVNEAPHPPLGYSFLMDRMETRISLMIA